MNFRLQHYGLGIFSVPVTYYFVSVYLGEYESNFQNFLPILVSTVIGFALAGVFAELFSRKITQLYWLVTLIVGLTLMSIIFLLKWNELSLIDPLVINLSFCLLGFSYKEEVLSKLSG
ncbi:MAG: hypothetical protein ACI9DO_000443 [Reinekea sp.]|jgi:hypothetical protein